MSVTKYSRYPISYVAVEAILNTDLLEPDEIRSLFQVYVIYIKGSSLCCCEHYGMTDPFAKDAAEFNVTLLQSHQNGIYLQINSNVPPDMSSTSHG